MRAERLQRDRHSISGKIRQLILYLTIPLSILVLFILALFLIYNARYARVS